MPLNASDQELIAGCLRKDAASWEAFVERFARLVHWSIRETLDQPPPGGKEEFCREVFQDLFTRLLDRDVLAKLRQAENVRKFLIVMASHMAFDRLKSVSRHVRKTQPLEEQLLAEPPAEVPTGEWNGVLHDSLQDLSMKDRACLEFYFVQHKTAQEIGEILGLGEGAVRSAVRRAKERLRKKLLENGYQEGVEEGHG